MGSHNVLAPKISINFPPSIDVEDFNRIINRTVTRASGKSVSGQDVFDVNFDFKLDFK